MDAAIILNRGHGHTKVDCHANYTNCAKLAVLIPFQIFIPSAVQSFSKTEWYFYKKKPKMCFLCTAAIFCTQLYVCLISWYTMCRCHLSPPWNRVDVQSWSNWDCVGMKRHNIHLLASAWKSSYWIRWWGEILWEVCHSGFWFPISSLWFLENNRTKNIWHASK